MTYEEFLKQKQIGIANSGFDIDREKLNLALFDFQKDIVKWCLKKGKSAIWADCGLGKTPMQLEWSYQVHKKTSGDILIVAPLAVTNQTVRDMPFIFLISCYCCIKCMPLIYIHPYWLCYLLPFVNKAYSAFAARHYKKVYRVIQQRRGYCTRSIWWNNERTISSN